MKLSNSDLIFIQTLIKLGKPALSRWGKTRADELNNKIEKFLNEIRPERPLDQGWQDDHPMDFGDR